ncbi:rhodanese-like domain-containing protein [Nonomuraea gerenzanensis]|uniref:Rhodanese-like n=1 Tax=Nonomuraea gerenzanensis TaxID=93944 RepID=A0A1M4EBF1_9ACTN|nr:rhodanese-like domain-containing protein [Nonomuraea gerenzanensis]UBU18298.1 rhodanese-like domain-containing protein [Nonomuraea gerenzanensis]SBO96120.1 Rhodanese-like [Nonomuraea gerenzanensis]
MSSIDAASARSLIAANPDVLVVDVRTPAEFGTAHIDGAVNLPLDQVDAHLRRIVTDAGGLLLLICQSGNRAERARAALSDAGLSDVAVLDGGMNAWIASGAPVNRGRARWPLERQVRLVAGGLVLAAVVASLWIPVALAVAGLVGAGLTFAALTDTCAMGLLLARLPYNRAGGVDVEAALTRLRGSRTGG